MDRKTLPWLLVMGVFGLAAVVSFAVPAPVFAVSTSTVVGWLFPDGTHWNNAVGALLYPLVGVGLFAGMAKLVGAEGGMGVTLILSGLTIGGLLGMLSIDAVSTNVLPFALVVVPGADLLIWMWKGEG